METLGWLILALFGMLMLLVVAPIVVQLTWAYSVSQIFGLPELTFTQAFCLYHLCRILTQPSELPRKSSK